MVLVTVISTSEFVTVDVTADPVMVEVDETVTRDGVIVAQLADNVVEIVVVVVDVNELVT
jgi:hypothetical protein